MRLDDPGGPRDMREMPGSLPFVKSIDRGWSHARETPRILSCVTHDLGQCDIRLGAHLDSSCISARVIKHEFSARRSP